MKCCFFCYGCTYLSIEDHTFWTWRVIWDIFKWNDFIYHLNNKSIFLQKVLEYIFWSKNFDPVKIVHCFPVWRKLQAFLENYFLCRWGRCEIYSVVSQKWGMCVQHNTRVTCWSGKIYQCNEEEKKNSVPFLYIIYFLAPLWLFILTRKEIQAFILSVTDEGIDVHLLSNALNGIHSARSAAGEPKICNANHYYRATSRVNYSSHRPRLMEKLMMLLEEDYKMKQSRSCT